MTMELQPQHRALIKRLSHGGAAYVPSSLWAPIPLSWKPFIYAEHSASVEFAQLLTNLEMPLFRFHFIRKVELNRRAHTFDK